MKLIIFGATGSIGSQLVSQALTNNHQVIAFARNPQDLKLEHLNLSRFAGDVLNPNSVSEAVKGCDGVLISLGSKKLTGQVRSVGTQNIVTAMQQHQVKRLICQTTLGIGDSKYNLNFFWRYIMFALMLRFVLKDHQLQEEIVKHSSLDWTIVRPAAFTDEALKETYKSGFSATEKKLSLNISRSDVASFMLLQLTDNTYLKQSPGLSY